MMRVLALAPALALLGGCVSLLPDPPPTPNLFDLRAQSAPVAAASLRSTSPLVLSVETPFASRMLSGAEIAWRRDGVVAYVAQSLWTDRTPSLLQTLMVDTIDAQDIVRAAVRSGSGVRTDYEVQWELSRFEVEEDGGTLTARFEASARVVELRTRRLVAEDRAVVAQPISDRSVRVATEALQGAAREGVARLAETAATRAAEDAAARAAEALQLSEPGVTPAPRQ
jgi:cholesterol transport system auxiliary component